MSRLFSLKKWVTLDDAAKRLTLIFNEEVKVRDVLQLVLDGHLTLSVDFPNHADGRLLIEKQTPIAEFVDKWLEIIAEFHKFTSTSQDPEIKKTSEIFELPTTIEEKIEFFIKLKGWDEQLVGVDRGKITFAEEDYGKRESLSGVYDLPMTGAERLDVEHLYQKYIGGPDITLTCLDGAHVIDENGNKYQLLDRFSASKDLNEIIRDKIGEMVNNSSDESLSQEELPKKTKPFSENDYYPSSGLPDDSVLVIRTSSLNEFEKNILNTDKAASEATTFIKEDRWYDVIGTMAILLYEAKPQLYGKGSNNKNMNASGIAESIKDRIQKIDIGLSPERLSNLNKDIGEALKRKPFSTYSSK